MVTIPLTVRGAEKLKEELARLKGVERHAVIQAISEARAQGDLSENAEYEDAKNEQAFVEGQIQRLEGLVKNAIVIDSTHGTDHVQIGSTVEGVGSDGKESFTIVGRKGESVVVHVPAGDFSYKIVKIS